MTVKTTNLGLVMAIWVGIAPPNNKNVLWFDTSLATPLHKFYNQTTASWEEFVYSTLIDNVTIKKNGSNQLYVDTSEIPALIIGDGSIALIKLADVPTGTVFYRKTAGDGAPETQTLAQLKADLGLTGTNSGDQDLSAYVLKLTTVNGKALTGNIYLTALDVGAPSGSGLSTGTNSGDETKSSILSKLQVSVISGDNTGDQNASGVPISDAGGFYDSDNVEDALQEAASNFDSSSLKSITLSAGLDVAAKISGATVPLGWTLSVGDTSTDILITHNLGKRAAFINLYYVDVDEEVLLIGTQAYNGIRTTINTITINSIATGITSLPVKIYIRFA